MSDPEPDAVFRTRLHRVVDEADRALLAVVSGSKLDAIGRKYDRFRTGVPLRGIERGSANANFQPPLRHDDGLLP